MSSPSDNSSALLPGQSAPLSIITPTDQRGIVIIATALALSFALVSILIRVFIRVEFRQRVDRDDIAVAFATAFSVIQSSLVFLAVSKGFGETIDNISPSDLGQLQRILYASDLFYIITVWLTKFSVGLLFLRLSPDKRHMLMSHIILGTSTLLLLVGLLIVALRCDLLQPWIFVDARCPGWLTRWQVVAAFDIVTEVFLLATAVYIVHGLQLSMWKKTIVIFAFGLRIPVIAPALLRLWYLGTAISSEDPTLDGVLASVMTQIQISYAIIAATTPCLRPFMTALSTNYGAPATAKSSPFATMQSRSRSDQNISLASMSRREKPQPVPAASKATVTTTTTTTTMIRRPPAPTTRWDNTVNRTEVTSGDHQSVASDGSRQMIISKNTEWTVDYDEER